ncbi:hypothetical protein MMC07_007214 [Pseudocyphellaria aurata]|nr:hypothetical protein [Pseudocyphellaria aurata]
MTHRDREPREWERRGDRREPDRREPDRREPDRREPDRREPDRRGDRGRESGLNEFFVDGEGIHRDVMQREICKYLGPEAYSRPGTYNGAPGYIVTAVRPFTPKMIDDLQMLSESWVSENRDLSRRGYEGSPTRSSPVTGLPNQDLGVPYQQSQTSRRSDRSDSSLPSSQDPYMEARYPPQLPYTSAGVNPSYTPTSGGYQPPPPNYATPQMAGYPSSGYAQVPGGYQQGTAYPQSVYQTGPVYPSSSGYSAPSYPAIAGRTPNPNDQNYTYDTGEYSNPGYQYRQPGAFPTGGPPRDPRPDLRTDPRSAPGYPYVTTPQDSAMRGAATEDRYATYGQSMPAGQAGRNGFPTPARGTPTGGYEPAQPFERESERRRR